MRLTSETNSTVTSILARCLLEPEFQRALSDDPEGILRTAGLSRDVRSSFAGFDFTKLKSFGGLITQTQHNFLWETFPYSRALLKCYQIEISMFSSYRQRIIKGKTVAPSRYEKIEQFVAYLKEFLQPPSRARQYPGLLETLTHESICWDLQETPMERDIGLGGHLINLPPLSRSFDRFVPDFPRNVRFADYRYDPLKIGLALERKDFEPTRLKPRRRCLFYRMDPTTKELSVSEASSVVWRMLQKVDGHRTVGSILRAETSGRSGREMRRYFRAACERGFIRLRSVQ